MEIPAEYDRSAISEFLKSLQILAPGTRSLCIDETGEAIVCPPD